MARIWVTSDTHFNHGNIINYCHRPFPSAPVMDEELIARWNDRVRPEDHVWHLGDVLMGKAADAHRVLSQLHGHKRLLLGNHDDQFNISVYAQYFEKIRMWRLIKPLILTHVPIHRDSFGKATVNVHGHIHNNPGPAGPYINVSVEVTDYAPVLLDQLLAWATEMERVR